jgi:hypothetical protein
LDELIESLLGFRKLLLSREEMLVLNAKTGSQRRPQKLHTATLIVACLLAVSAAEAQDGHASPAQPSDTQQAVAQPTPPPPANPDVTYGGFVDVGYLARSTTP